MSSNAWQDVELTCGLCQTVYTFKTADKAAREELYCPNPGCSAFQHYLYEHVMIAHRRACA